MKIVCVGGGPAGLYLSILLKKANPALDISVIERNQRGSTFGWGVVFSDETMENIHAADSQTADEIDATLAHWDDIEVHFKGKTIRSSGHGFCGIARVRLLDILQQRAESLGVKLKFGANVENLDQFSGVDIIVACDGVFSKIRTQYESQFKPDYDKRICKYTWLGTHRMFDAFTFIFKETLHGWFQAHSYRFSDELSTFIVECHGDTWQRAGLDSMSKEENIAFCERLFAEYLNGEKLISNADHLIGSASWMNFLRVSNESWHYKNIVLLGDAAATAHFSIGSGTRLALKGAITLAENILNTKNKEDAFQNYQETHRVEVLKLQSAARNSTEWFESVKQKSKLLPEQFAYSLLTRSQRVSHENLRIRDKTYLEGMESWYFQHETGRAPSKSVPPMFVPFKLRGMELVNRIVVSPMAMYSAVDGTPTDFHLVHFGARALGGAGLIFTEMTNVSPEARITPGCAGMYSDEHIPAWRRIVDFVHSRSSAKIAMQLGHSGPKGSTQLGWEKSDEPLLTGNWEVIAPSAIPYGPNNQVPREMNRADMDKVTADFVQAAEKAEAAGFDMLELHCAHGYLLSTFISPLTNKRTDKYGGVLENRLRFPLEVFDAIRNVWPKMKPMSVRISAVDWVDHGTSVQDSVEIARKFKEHGADLIDVSTGQVSKLQRPVYGRMYQVPFSENIRLEVEISTMAVGNIFEPDHANSILAAGRADLCLLARPHLADPHWTLRAAAELGYQDQNWPPQYLSAKRQLETNLRRAKEFSAK